MVFFQETQERVRNSRCKRAISVQATEVLLYLCYMIPAPGKSLYSQRFKTLP